VIERRAPILVLAVGNPSRGDDALGPLLAERIESAASPHVEVITAFQLQIENALDLEGRSQVFFVDAGTGTAPPFELHSIEPADEFLHSSHALTPQTVLATYVKVKGEPPPPSMLLCIRGESFELGEPLSAGAAANLEAAWRELSRRLAELARR